jgi:signal transduction histidine kinase
MKRLWRDTLFKRLFLLMWAALVLSHLLAFALVTQWGWGGPGPEPGAEMSPPPAPVFPSMPPTPGMPGGGPGQAPPPLPTGALLLDYGVRFLLIGLAAWWGARWLAAPMRRLVDASHALTSSIGRGGSVPTLDERRGTREVREAAQVFNDMARQLDAQFKGRSLLVAAISHDLRTPLTRVRMRLESLAHEPAAQRCIADVREMNELIDSALQLFRGDGFTEPAQSTDVLAMVQAQADDLAEQGHAVTASGAPGTARVQPGALRRALSNLLGNAARYGERADVKVFRDAAGVTVVIEDTGPGIPDDQLEAVFQPFYRVESSRNRRTGGTGLGLHIARDLVQRQGGTLKLANRPEGGLRATVFLPHR